MLERLDDVPWAELGHAYGSAEDVPGLIRQLLDPDREQRVEALRELYGNVYHQETRFEAASHVVPFLLELVADPATPDRGELLVFWGHLITGAFNVQERPTWSDGDGSVFAWGERTDYDPADDYHQTLHRIYRESLTGHDLACSLLDDPDPDVRAGAAFVLACLPTRGDEALPLLADRPEPVDRVRAMFAFAMGELGAVDVLRGWLAHDPAPEVRCMAACQLARLEPSAALLEPLMAFVADPIDGYAAIFENRSGSTEDVEFALGCLPLEVRDQAVTLICDRLDRIPRIETTPLVTTLIGVAFPRQYPPVTALTALQRRGLARLVNAPEVWQSRVILWSLEQHGLPREREACARLVRAAGGD